MIQGFFLVDRSDRDLAVPELRWDSHSWAHRGGHLDQPSQYSVQERRWRTALTLVLAVYGWQCLRAPGNYGWLDSLDLAIHETGHLVFAFGGETLTLLGGTLFQLLVPAAFVVALWRQGDRHGATVPLWWLGQNCWNISVYIKDAQAQVLPLVGGGEHDWAILLDQWGWLERDQALGRAVFLLGVVLYGTALVAGWLLLYPRPRQQVSDPRIQPTNAR
jgi:hypothetical protein